AHGDLHHGNIFLDADGNMTLIDHDSMFVPPLAGLPNSEIGHPNFQHPAYHFPSSPRPFDANMDNFSSIVIYLSLLAVADEPRLWKVFHDAKEENNLIFKGLRDFKHPEKSRLLKRLIEKSRNRRVRGLAKKLVEYAKGPAAAVPSLE